MAFQRLRQDRKRWVTGNCCAEPGSGGVDGTPITSGEQSRISIYATTNLVLPFSNWTRLTNSIQLTNGFLQVTDTNTSALRFHRAVETP